MGVVGECKSASFRVRVKFELKFMEIARIE